MLRPYDREMERIGREIAVGEEELGGKAAETLSASLLAAGSTVGVDAVSGSTMTSDAVFAAMNDCLAQAAQ